MESWIKAWRYALAEYLPEKGMQELLVELESNGGKRLGGGFQHDPVWTPSTGKHGLILHPILFCLVQNKEVVPSSRFLYEGWYSAECHCLARKENIWNFQDWWARLLAESDKLHGFKEFWWEVALGLEAKSLWSVLASRFPTFGLWSVFWKQRWDAVYEVVEKIKTSKNPITRAMWVKFQEERDPMQALVLLDYAEEYGILQEDVLIWLRNPRHVQGKSEETGGEVPQVASDDAGAYVPDGQVGDDGQGDM